MATYIAHGMFWLFLLENIWGLNNICDYIFFTFHLNILPYYFLHYLLFTYFDLIRIRNFVTEWSDLFTRSNEIHRYNIRHATKGNYYQKEAKLEIFKRSFSRTRAKVWNLIPCDWRGASKFVFKKKNSQISFRYSFGQGWLCWSRHLSSMSAPWLFNIDVTYKINLDILANNYAVLGIKFFSLC